MASIGYPGKNPHLCRIKHEYNQSLLTMPDGTVIPAQVFMRVTNNVNERPYAIVKVFVNLDDTTDIPLCDHIFNAQDENHFTICSKCGEHFT